MATSKQQQEVIDLNHYNALRELQAGMPVHRLNAVTRRAMIKRGFMDESSNEITPAGLAFLDDQPAAAAIEITTANEPTMTTVMSEREYYAELMQHNAIRDSIRRNRDRMLETVQRVIEVKAPEITPLIEAIQEASNIVEDWE